MSTKHVNIKPALRLVGMIGTVTCIGLFVHSPSFPTPDKILVFMVFIFMIFNQGWEMFKRFGPFVFILLAYDSFRGFVPALNKHVHYTVMPHFDTAVFGKLPTITLQHWLWHGYVQWYDFVFYGAYMMHFVLPILLALLIWKKRPQAYWQFVMAYIITSFTAFGVFLLYPAAPPWLASDNSYIPHIVRISSSVYSAMGITDFPSVYNSFAPNPVAAVPSLHAAYSTLFTLFAFTLFGKKWGVVSLIYPALIFLGVVYMGEHYIFDALTGSLLAVVAFFAAPYVLTPLKVRLISGYGLLKNRWLLVTGK